MAEDKAQTGGVPASLVDQYHAAVQSYTTEAQAYWTRITAFVLLNSARAAPSRRGGESLGACRHRCRSPILDSATGALRFTIKDRFTSLKFRRSFGIVTDNDVITLSTTEHPDLELAWQQLSHTDQLGTGQIVLTHRDGTRRPVPFELFSNSYNLFLLVHARRGGMLARRLKVVSG